MPITLEQNATLKHINIRKEGPDDDKHLVVDIKLQLIASSDILIEFDPTLRGMLFTREGEKRYPKLAPIKWAGEMRHMELEIAGVEFMNVTLRKFQIDPLSLPGQEFCDLTFLATFAPEGRETAIIAEQVGEETLVKIRAGAQLDLGGEGETVKAAMEALGETLAEDGAILTISGPNGKSVTIGDVDRIA